MLTETHRKLISEALSYFFAPLLIITCYLAFHFFSIVAGDRMGYLLGMIFYWLFCCILPAFFWITKTNRRLLFRITKLNWWQLLLIVTPVALATVFGPFRQRIHEATALVVLLSLPYAFVNAFSEEVLWRGVFFVRHQGNFFYAVVVASIWFGIWHYAPLSIHPAGVGNFKFIIAAIGLGCCWGTVTYYSRSLFWAIVSHTLLDFTGLGILIYSSG